MLKEKLARLQSSLQSINQSLKTPQGICQIYNQFFQKFWYHRPLEFSPFGGLVYRNPKDYPNILRFQILEIVVMIIYGLILCPYVVYKNWRISRSVKENVKYNEYVYYDVSWIHKSLYLAAILTAICAIYIDYILQIWAEEVQKAFAALEKFKIGLNQKGKLWFF